MNYHEPTPIEQRLAFQSKQNRLLGFEESLAEQKYNLFLMEKYPALRQKEKEVHNSDDEISSKQA